MLVVVQLDKYRALHGFPSMQCCPSKLLEGLRVKTSVWEHPEHARTPQDWGLGVDQFSTQL